jgi:hypothetical protein
MKSILLLLFNTKSQNNYAGTPILTGTYPVAETFCLLNDLTSGDSLVNWPTNLF